MTAAELVQRMADGETVGSRNAEARLAAGWELGRGKWAPTEPHHVGPHDSMTYVEMFDARRERAIAAVMEGDAPGEVADLWVVTYTDDPAAIDESDPVFVLVNGGSEIREVRVPAGVAILGGGEIIAEERGRWTIGGRTYRYRVEETGATAVRS